MTTGKGTRHASVRTAAALSATLMLTTACSVLPGLSGDLSTNGPCPDGWNAAVLWSTENGTASTIDYIKPDNTIAQQHLPWIGLTAGPGNLLDRRGDDLVTVTNGNMDRDKTHIVTLSTTACSLSAVQIPEPLVLGVGTSPDATFTTNGINGAGWVHRHDLDGKTTAEVDYPNVIPSKPVWHDGTLSVFAEELAEGEGTSGTPLLLVLDDRTMKERARLRLPSDVSLVQDSLVKDGKLYFPHTGASDGSTGEGTKLGVIDLATLQRSEIALDKPAPYLLASTADHIYIGHTFMNPSYRPMTDYVWITRYTPATGRTETFDIGTEAGIGVNAITTTDDTLYILGTGTDEEQVTLLTYNLPDMTERSRTTIHRPTGYGHRYPAGLIVP